MIKRPLEDLINMKITKKVFQVLALLLMFSQALCLADDTICTAPTGTKLYDEGDIQIYGPSSLPKFFTGTYNTADIKVVSTGQKAITKVDMQLIGDDGKELDAQGWSLGLGVFAPTQVELKERFDSTVFAHATEVKVKVVVEWQVGKTGATGLIEKDNVYSAQVRNLALTSVYRGFGNLGIHEAIVAGNAFQGANYGTVKGNNSATVLLNSLKNYQAFYITTHNQSPTFNPGSLKYGLFSPICLDSSDISEIMSPGDLQGNVNLNRVTPPFHFVFLDSCASASTFSYLKAFHLSDPDGIDKAFVGWDFPVRATQGTSKSTEFFWGQLGAGETAGDAAYLMNTRKPAYCSPGSDEDPLTVQGDLNMTLTNRVWHGKIGQRSFPVEPYPQTN